MLPKSKNSNSVCADDRVRSMEIFQHAIIGPSSESNVRKLDPVKGGVSHRRKKSIRLRDFFPEVWVFDTANLTDSSLNKSLTVPDTLTTWEANAVCFTPDAGLWMPSQKPHITVKMPFFVEFAPPVVARRNEILHLTVSVFVYPEDTVTSTSQMEGGDASKSRRTCYEVEVGVETDPLDWRVVGAASFTTCICTGDEKETFRLPMRPLRVGHLNITATAVGRRNSGVCDDGSASGSDSALVGGGVRSREVVTVGDAVRRSVRVVAEGIEKCVTIGGTFCATESEHFPTYFFIYHFFLLTTLCIFHSRNTSWFIRLNPW